MSRAGRCTLSLVSTTIDPDPSEAEREAILAALGRADGAGFGEWAEAALLEGVEHGEPGELDP